MNSEEKINIQYEYFENNTKKEISIYKSGISLLITGIIATIININTQKNTAIIENNFDIFNPLICNVKDYYNNRYLNILNGNFNFINKENIKINEENNIEYTPDEEELLKFIGTLGSFETKISSLSNKKTEKEINRIKSRANKKISSGETYLNHSINYFKNTESLDKKRGILKIPENIRKILAPIIPGLISQESNYILNAENPSGALGSTQVLKSNIKYEREIFLSSFPLQIKESYRNFERIWTIFKNGSSYTYKGKNKKVPGLDFESIKKEYSLNDNELEIFLVLSMVNAYNTGETRMLKIIHRFQKEVPNKIANKRNDLNGEGLYNLMSELAYHKKWKKGYREDSFNYTPGTIAYAKALGILEEQKSDITNNNFNNKFTSLYFNNSYNNKFNFQSLINETPKSIDKIIYISDKKTY